MQIPQRNKKVTFSIWPWEIGERFLVYVSLCWSYSLDDSAWLFLTTLCDTGDNNTDRNYIFYQVWSSPCLWFNSWCKGLQMWLKQVYKCHLVRMFSIFWWSDVGIHKQLYHEYANKFCSIINNVHTTLTQLQMIRNKLWVAISMSIYVCPGKP